MNFFKKSLVIAALCVLGAQMPVHAQWGMGKKSEIEEVQNRPLIVLLETPSDKVIKKLTKKHKEEWIEEYKSAIEEHNADMKEMVEKFWTFSKGDIVYKTWDEIKEIKKQKKKDYALLMCANVVPNKFSAGEASEPGLDWRHEVNGKDDDDRDFLNQYTVIRIGLIEKLGAVALQPLPDIFPTKSDLAFGLQGAQTYMTRRLSKTYNMHDIKDDIKESAPKLANKTLLLRKDWVKMNKAEVKAVYPYDFKLVDKDEFDEAIINADAKYAYAMIVPYVESSSSATRVFFIQVAVDAEDGNYLGMSLPNAGLIMVTGGLAGKGNRYIKDADLKAFAKYVNKDD